MSAETTREFVVLVHWEACIDSLVAHTEKWPRTARASLTQRTENLAFTILEQLIIARYSRRARARALRLVNLELEKLRFCLRIAHRRRFIATIKLERVLRDIDEAGRMVHAWRNRMPAAPTTRGTRQLELSDHATR